MILGSEVSDNLCSILRLALAQGVKQLFSCGDYNGSLNPRPKKCMFGGGEGGCCRVFCLCVKMKGILEL